MGNLFIDSACVNCGRTIGYAEYLADTTTVGATTRVWHVKCFGSQTPPQLTPAQLVQSAKRAELRLKLWGMCEPSNLRSDDQLMNLVRGIEKHGATHLIDALIEFGAMKSVTRAGKPVYQVVAVKPPHVHDWRVGWGYVVCANDDDGSCPVTPPSKANDWSWPKIPGFDITDTKTWVKYDGEEPSV